MRLQAICNSLQVIGSYAPMGGQGFAPYYANNPAPTSAMQNESFLQKVYRSYHAQGKQKDALNQLLDKNNTAFAEQVGWDMHKLGAEAAFAKYVPSNAGMFAEEEKETQWEKLFGAGREENVLTKVAPATYEAPGNGQGGLQEYGEMTLSELLQARESHNEYMNSLPAWERTRALNAAPSARYAEAQAELREIDREIRIRNRNDRPLAFIIHSILMRGKEV